MHRWMWPVLLMVLAGCGGMGAPGGGGGGGEPNAFTMTCTPNPFYAPKGGQAILTVTVGNLKGKVAKVRFSFVQGTKGVNGSPATQTVEGMGSAQFTILVDGGITDNKPYFYIYAVGMDSENRTSGMPQTDCKVQWSY